MRTMAIKASHVVLLAVSMLHCVAVSAEQQPLAGFGSRGESYFSLLTFTTVML